MSLLDQAKGHWRLLLKFGIWVMIMVGSFAVPPPESSLKSGMWYHFALFIVAATSGLLLAPMRWWNRPAHLRGWWMSAIVCVALTIVGFFFYIDTFERVTEVYGKKRIV